MDNERSIRWNMLISGTVQRVGFRHIIQGIARRHRITGCVKNLEGYDVQIIAEGNSEDLSHFKDEISIQDYPIYVENIDVCEESFTGEYSYFEITRGTPEEELAERFDSAIAIFSRMEKKQDIAIDLGRETVSLQKESLSLQKETLSLQKETLSLQNDTISLQKETLHEVKGIRQDLNKTLTQEIAEVKEELREIRSALIQAGIMRYAHS
ncbi:MAG: acylphosphatase [Methanospirillum sp.]|uniref:acylphosphatase n=1 Tax=Methanospirillum sp. TaxID=45200 RepID=UPI00236B1BBC|nr:acylphosphatase [Methanospirillum sp.]MDD1729848.1 acylphosphatase [Methanospirillum sp.]